jgi:hypothetical protein
MGRCWVQKNWAATARWPCDVGRGRLCDRTAAAITLEHAGEWRALRSVRWDPPFVGPRRLPGGLLWLFRPRPLRLSKGSLRVVDADRARGRSEFDFVARIRVAVGEDVVVGDVAGAMGAVSDQEPDRSLSDDRDRDGCLGRRLRP